MALYSSKVLFNGFRDKDYAMFLQRLNTKYKISIIQFFLKTLLNESYNIVLGKLQAISNKDMYFNL